MASAFQQWLAQARPEGTGSTQPTNPDYPIVVVGAGPAGLAAMVACRQAGLEFVGIESHDNIGGIWDPTNAVSSVYDRMHTNTSRYTTYIGPGMSSDLPFFPHHSKALDYLKDYADSEGVADRIRFNSKFVDAKKSSRNTWVASIRDTHSQETNEIEARALVFATGMHNRNQICFPDSLRDEAVSAGLDVIHSCDYRRPEDYDGQRVLVVGLGQSGSDIADEISRHAKRVVLVSRSTPWMVSSMLFGQPADKVADTSGNFIPAWFQLLCARVLQRVYLGHPSRLGLPAPDHRLLEKFAVTDRGFVKAVREQRVALRTQLARFEPGGLAVFEDGGESEHFNSVIFATGYERRYPLLEPTGKNLSGALSFLLFHRQEPGLAYMSETIATRGCWPVFAEQGRAIATYFAAEQQGRRNVSQFNARRQCPSPNFKGHVYAKADEFHVEFHRYTNALRELSGWLVE